MERTHAVAITFSGLGDGETIRDLPAEALLPPGQRVVSPTYVPYAQNLRLTQGLAVTRPGYKSFLATPAARRVMGLYAALFDDGSSDTMRADTQKIWRNAAGTWTDVSGAVTFTGGNNDPFVFTMAPYTAGPPGNQLVFTNGIDAIYRYRTGGGAIVALGGTPPTTTRALATFLSRCYAFNVLSGGTQREHRVQWSIAGNSENWTGLGSGFVDLDGDSYPGVALLPLAGRLIAFKGNQLGGAIWVGTPTGDVRQPVRWDPLNPGSDVGLLIPRSLVTVNPGLVFFVGHDGFYLYDGARSLLPIGERMTRDVLARVNSTALRAGFAWYRPSTYEITVGIPTGNADYPTEFWTVDVRSRRVYGPYDYAADLTAATSAQPTGGITWDTIPLTDATWDTINASSWDVWGASSAARSLIYGDTGGATWEDTGSEADDAGMAITVSWRSPAITPDRLVRLSHDGRPLELDVNAGMTLRQVTLRYRDDSAWTPSIGVSTDGGSSWTTVSDGTSTGSGSMRVLPVTYHTEIHGAWFQIRAERAAGGRMSLYSVEAELTYAGSNRA